MAARQFAYLSMPCTYFSKGLQNVRIVTFRGFPCSLFSFSSAPLLSSPSSLFICLNSPANQIISLRSSNWTSPSYTGRQLGCSHLLVRNSFLLSFLVLLVLHDFPTASEAPQSPCLDYSPLSMSPLDFSSSHATTWISNIYNKPSDLVPVFAPAFCLLSLFKTKT